MQKLQSILQKSRGIKHLHIGNQKYQQGFPSIYKIPQNYNKLSYKYSSNNNDSNNQQEQHQQSYDEVVRQYFQYKVQETIQYQVDGVNNLYGYKVQETDKKEFKKEVMYKTMLATLGGLSIGQVGLYFKISSLYPLVAMFYLPKYFLKESPDYVYRNDKNALKFQNSLKQYGYFAALVGCTGMMFSSFFKFSWGLLPVFTFYSVYLQNLQKKGKLNENEALKGIGAINLLFIMETIASESENSLANIIFLNSVGNNLFLFFYAFFITHQQKILDVASKHGYYDELNSIFVSLKFQQLSYQRLSWKYKGMVIFLALVIMAFQIYIRSYKNIHKMLNDNEEVVDFEDGKMKVYKKDKNSNELQEELQDQLQQGQQLNNLEGVDIDSDSEKKLKLEEFKQKLQLLKEQSEKRKLEQQQNIQIKQNFQESEQQLQQQKYNYENNNDSWRKEYAHQQQRFEDYRQQQQNNGNDSNGDQDYYNLVEQQEQQQNNGGKQEFSGGYEL